MSCCYPVHMSARLTIIYGVRSHKTITTTVGGNMEPLGWRSYKLPHKLSGFRIAGSVSAAAQASTAMPLLSARTCRQGNQKS